MRSTYSQRRSQLGMTLIEIMIVLAILGGLIAVLATNVAGRFSKAQVEEAKVLIREIGKSLDMYRTDCGTYPTTDQGLQALIQAPADCKSWGPEAYMKKLPNDPWKNELIYEQKSASSYILMSLGSDRQEGGSGDAADISSEEL